MILKEAGKTAKSPASIRFLPYKERRLEYSPPRRGRIAPLSWLEPIWKPPEPENVFSATHIVSGEQCDVESGREGREELGVHSIHPPPTISSPRRLPIRPR